MYVCDCNVCFIIVEIRYYNIRYYFYHFSSVSLISLLLNFTLSYILYHKFKAM